MKSINHFSRVTVFLIGILFSVSQSQADCQDKVFTCTSGESINQGMCFDKGSLNPLHPRLPSCQPCGDWKHKCKDFPKYNTRTWMGDLYGILKDKTLSQIIIPGSHDSGMNRTKHCTIGAENCNTKTQWLDIAHQLNSGVRVFDLRPSSYINGKFYAGHYQDHVKALGIDLGNMGCDGTEINSAFSSIRKFIEKNPKELVILHFSHASHLKKKQKTDFVNLVVNMLGNHLYKYDKDDTDINLLTNSYEEIITTGRVIATFDGFSNDINPNKGILGKGVIKIKGGYTKTNSYSEMTHTQWTKLKDFKREDNELYALYWTLTMSKLDTVICGRPDPLSDISIKHYATIANREIPNEFMSALKHNRIRIGHMPNIIYTDFSGQTTSRSIIVLNLLLDK